MRAQGGEIRQILFLQGLPGRFFGDLAQNLGAQGHGVHRINFNGGDLCAWPARGAVNYRGSSRDWPCFLVKLIADRAITDLVLFGDCRPMHRIARATAAGLGLAVHVFEEGYIRPDWITLERGGVNGFSPMPDDPAWYRRTAAALDAIPEAAALPGAFIHRARASIAYYAAAVLLAWSFPRHRTHRPWNPLIEAGGWVARLARRKTAAARSQMQKTRLSQAPYFVLPLQLDSDYQLRAHSDFDGMQPAVARTLASFARHAQPEACLVVKEHPLDNGLNNWRKQTLDYARALGVSDRVIFLELADIDLLVRSAQGVITVNSTTGTLALAAGVPVATLGRAVYDIPGLTHQGTLDSFWTRPQTPDLDLYEAFRRVLAHRCLLRGGFYDVQSRTGLVAAASARILADEPDSLQVAAPATRSASRASSWTAVEPPRSRCGRSAQAGVAHPIPVSRRTDVSASTGSTV